MAENHSILELIAALERDLDGFCTVYPSIQVLIAHWIQEDRRRRPPPYPVTARSRRAGRTLVPVILLVAALSGCHASGSWDLEVTPLTPLPAPQVQE